MVKAIEQVRQDFDQLNGRVATVQAALQSVYQDYLDCVGEHAKRHLILASYQLCTQVYPERFLALSYTQRHDLQRQLRQLGKDVEYRLRGLLSLPGSEKAREEPGAIASESPDDVIGNLFVEIKNLENPEALEQEIMEALQEYDQEGGAEGLAPEHEANDDLNAAGADTPEAADEAELEQPELSKLAEQIAGSLSALVDESQQKLPPQDKASPDYWIVWSKTQEQRIQRTLDRISHAVNQGLQTAHMLPDTVPAKILDVAIRANKRQEKGELPNHLTKVAIDVKIDDKNGKNKHKRRTRLTLLHLKLAELEFSEPGVAAQRRRIKDQIDKLRRLKKQYQRVQQNLAIAEAEAAWRSSWYDRPD